MSSSNNNINPKPCVYGCGIQIYWNNSVNEYWEVITKKRHICPNIVSNKNKTSITPPSNAPKPYYYNSMVDNIGTINDEQNSHNSVFFGLFK
jgi:hypothetical protein